MIINLNERKRQLVIVLSILILFDAPLAMPIEARDFLHLLRGVQGLTACG